MNCSFDFLLSIIIPVYNVEKYLSHCFASLAAQEDKNFEIILIDDGSSDKSGEMCDEFVHKHPDLSIQLIHQKNQGLAAARNHGIDIASGKYIAFLDSDDYLSQDFTSRFPILAENNNADMVICAYALVDGDSVQPQHMISELLSSESALEKLCQNKEIKNYAWGKIYRRDLFGGIQFPEGRLFEDIATTYKVFCKAEKILCVNEIGYYYRIRKDSITSASKQNAGWACQRCLSYIDRYTELSRTKPELIPWMLPDLMYSAGLSAQCFDSTAETQNLVIQKFFSEMVQGIIPGKEQLDFIQYVQMKILCKSGLQSRKLVFFHQMHRVYHKIVNR